MQNEEVEMQSDNSDGGRNGVKIAIIGQSGSGKSYFINNLLDQAVATVSKTETSDEKIETFAAPKNENFKLFEIPAITGLEFTRENFFDLAKFGENQYDFIFFLTKSSFTSDDFFLIKEIQKRQIPISILRTNIDASLDHGGAGDVEKVLDETRSPLKSKLKKTGVNVDTVSLFLIENEQKFDFEFRQSIESMLEALPEEKKQLLQSTIDDSLLTEVEIQYEQVEKWQDAEVNIAVVGGPASGKTTFIKTFMDDTFPENSETSNSELSIPSTAVFRSTKNPNITFHEIEMRQMHHQMVIPGQNAISFDYTFVLIQNNPSIEDCFVLEQLEKRDLASSIIRTHADEIVTKTSFIEGRNAKLRRCKTELKEKLYQQSLDMRIHLIDARSFADFEFLEALENLLVNVEEIKRVSLIFSLKIFENCHRWYPTRIDILVVGRSRHGKSSFINALVGTEVAKVGHYGDCTKEVTEFSLPNYPNIKIYDAPGISPTGCTREEFEAKMKLKENNYDAFFLVIKDVFNNDANFIREKIEAKKRPFCIVRTHADLTTEKFYNNVESRVVTEKRVSTDLREVLKSELIALKADPEKTPIYVVDNGHTDRFDFPKIFEDLSRNLPNMKAQQFLLCVTSFDPKMIEAKYKELNNLKWGCALLSGTGGLIPIPGPNIAADIGIFIATTVNYLSSFGLTKERINAQEKLHRLPKCSLEEEVVKFMQDQKFEVLFAIRNSAYFREGLEASSAGTAKLATVVVPLLGRALVMTTADDVLKATGFLVPLGMVVGAVTSFGMTSYLLDRELKNAKSCALFVSQLIQSMKNK